MKIFKQLVVVAIALLALASCQKELGFNTDGVSVGTLKKSTTTGDCVPATIIGIYKKDSVLTNNNYVDVEVNVSIAGTFDINADTVNGYSFHKSGNVGAGSNVIRLYPSGKPIATGTNTFTVKYGTSTCTFDITVVSASTGAAIYALGGAPGACTTFGVNGTYTTGVPMGPGNTVTFDVIVAQPGTWSISTLAANGISFSGSGVFTNTSAGQTVTLVATGIPGSLPSASFTPTTSTGGSSCSFVINFNSAATASFTLNGGPAPGTCTGAQVFGTYTSGVALNVGDSVVLGVNVTSAGSYSITTNAVNGLSFAATGTFTSAIPSSQTVTLKAVAGSPNNTTATTANFTASSGTSTSCIFSVNIGAPAGPTNLDYIPETIGTNWTDSLSGGLPSDTTYNEVSPRTTLQGGNTYRVFTVTNASGTFDSTYHRSGAGKYYEFLYGTLGFDNPFNKEVLLLDSTKSVGGTWSVDLGPNTLILFGIVLTDIKIDAQILAKGTTATVAGNGYSNVIKVKFVYSGDQGTGYSVLASEEFWYAKGKGLIRDIQMDQNGVVTSDFLTKRIQVF